MVDDGRGIPVERHAKKKVSALEVVFSELHAGGKFGGGAYTASGGLHGVGASVVNALSRRLVAEVERDGVRWRLTFEERQAGRFEGDRFVRTHELERVAKVPAGRTGTRVRFWPDRDLFDPEARISVGHVRDRVEQMCFLVPGLEITLLDRRDGAEAVPAGAKPETFRSARGLSDYVEQLSVGEPLIDPVLISGEGDFEENVPVDGRMQRVTRTCRVQAAFRWVKGYDTTLVSFVNTIPTPEGGTHLAGFERAFTYVVNDVLAPGDAKKLKRFKDEATRHPRRRPGRPGGRAAGHRSPSRSSGARPSASWARPAVQRVVYDVVKAGVAEWFERRQADPGRRGAGQDHRPASRCA